MRLPGDSVRSARERAVGQVLAKAWVEVRELRHECRCSTHSGQSLVTEAGGLGWLSAILQYCVDLLLGIEFQAGSLVD